MNQRAFTLVELSIVLVILGLLIGGVLTGQSLIRAAEIRSIATQQARFVTATHTFRDKYMGLPGDLTNATAYWGAADGSTGNTAACTTTASTTALTCNGDGNGLLENITSSREHFRFWQHLANAGLIEGSYNGIAAAGGTKAATSANSPSGRLSSSLWMASNFATQSARTELFDGVYDNTLLIGAPIASDVPGNPILKPEEVYNIDMKVDDGKPATGRVLVRAASGLNTCTTTSSSSTLTADYLLTNSAVACTLYFRQAF